MNKAFTAAQPQIKSYDPIWEQVRREAEETSANEPVLASLIYATILSEPTLEDAICHTVAHRLQPSVDTGLLVKTFREVLSEEPGLGEYFRADIMAVAKRDPACRRYLEPLFFFKGFVALETYRFANRLWQSGRRDFALYLQSQSSRVFAVDIHPAARMGKGIMLDHATGIVIGETAVVGDNCSMLHGVTLGGTGNERDDLRQHVTNGKQAQGNESGRRMALRSRRSSGPSRFVSGASGKVAAHDVRHGASWRRGAGDLD